MSAAMKSCAFIMPARSIYSANKFHIKDMVREGFVLNIMMAFVISFVCYFRLG